MVISQNNNNNNSSERTEVLHGEENVMNAILQFLSKAYRIDSISTSHIALANTGKSSYSNGGGGDNGNTDGSSSGSSSDTLTQGGATDDNNNNNGGINPTDISTKRIRDIEAGVDLADIEVIPSSTRAQEIYSNLVKSAAEEILWIFPTTYAFIRQDKIGAIQLAQQAAKERNVKVRILMPASSLIEQKVQQLKEYCHDGVIDVRYIVQMTETKATILVVDRKASLVMELRDDS